ncbi:hypothetical protein [Sphingomonas sp. 1P08PE]|uniref:hypothetical protein n=1 Tax=Sphingomonas sp. 1P08PE TaxID=554122 RepID=UPI00399F054D
MKCPALCAGAAALCLLQAGVAGARQIVRPMTSGMTITTSNSVASVEFRVRSAGPGYCVVRVWSSYGRENVLPAPSIWSPWLVLFSHTGRVSATIAADPGCSRETVFEIRYFAD